MNTLHSPPAYRQLVESLPGAVYACNNKGDITFYNNAALALWGRAPIAEVDRWCGAWRSMGAAGEPLPAERSPMALAVQEGQAPHARQILIERPDGKRQLVRSQAQPLRDSDGQVTGGVNLLTPLGSALPATVPVATPGALAQATLDSLTARVAVLDDLGTVVMVNATWRQYEADLGDGHMAIDEDCDYLRPCAMAARQGHPGAAELSEGLVGVLSGRLNRYEGEVAVGAPESRHWNAVRVTPLQLPGARHLVVAHVDITPRKLAEASRAELEQQLRESQKMEAVGTLASSIAHDFNNIIGAILGNCEVAIAHQAAGEQTRRHLAQIKKAGQRARSLVHKILSFSRRQPQSMTLQSVGDVVHESVELLQATLPSSAKLKTSLCDEALFLRMDSTQISQLMVNLGTNAWHALQGAPGTIEVGMAHLPHTEAQSVVGLQARDHVHLWVADDGCGIAEDVRARIFDAFYTTKPKGTGTGLGLSVVAEIVAQHGGTITVCSEVGAGSRFDVYLPAEVVSSLPFKPSGAGPASELLGEVGLARRVLYVEDDEIMLQLVDTLLRRAGFEVTCEQDALLAIESLRSDETRFDLVITDNHMPDYSGLDLAREVKALKPEIPVIVASGSVTDDLTRQARQAGAFGVLNKERTFEDLIDLVVQALGADATRPDAPACSCATPC